jgi:hypothetical protein
MRELYEGHLFSSAAWFAVAEKQKQKMLDEIRQLSENQVMNTSVDDLCYTLTNKYCIDVPVLDYTGVQIDPHDMQVQGTDVFGDRIIISGTRIDVIVPFTGEGHIFGIRPPAASIPPPAATVREQELLMSFTGTNLSADQVRSEIQGTLDEIKVHLDRLRNEAGGLNNELGQLARTHVEQRRQKFLNDHNLVAALGFPLKWPDNAAKTYRAPEVRRLIQVTAPLGSYEHILSVMASMALVMERSPSAFKTMGEEDLRQNFLVQLNGHYEGQATGETFNYTGKTDVLIRSGGKNIFIAECKYWNGPKKLVDTIDQLLGYLSWRDTKAAIVLFNRQKNFGQVVDQIRPTMTAHPNFKRDLGQTSESSSRYVLAHRDDPNREMIITVMAFDVPHPC